MYKVIIICLLAPMALDAAQREEIGPLNERPIRGSVARGSLPSPHLSVVGVTVGVDELGDVMKRLGQSTVFKIRVAGRPDAVCYYSSDPTDDSVVVFEAGPMGGWHTLTGATVCSSRAIPRYRKFCTKSAKVNRQGTATGGGISRGLSRSVIRRIVGQAPSFVDKVVDEYNWDTAKESSHSTDSGGTEQGDVGRHVLTGFTAVFSNGRLDWFQVYKVESD